MSKWKCVELGDTSGFTEGKIYEVGSDGTIHYDSGNLCEGVFKINGDKAECWWSKFEKVEEEKKDMNKFKVGDMVKGTERCRGKYNVTNEKYDKR